MKFYSFQIIIEKEPEDEGYFAYTPTVPGCFSNGKTIGTRSATFAKPSSSISPRCWSIPN
jgi:hypothetical protein